MQCFKSFSNLLHRFSDTSSERNNDDEEVDVAADDDDDHDLRWDSTSILVIFYISASTSPINTKFGTQFLYSHSNTCAKFGIDISIRTKFIIFFTKYCPPKW